MQVNDIGHLGANGIENDNSESNFWCFYEICTSLQMVSVFYTLYVQHLVCNIQNIKVIT